MDLMKRKIIDPEQPLDSEKQEAFCMEYVRLDIEDHIANKRARKVMAYRNVFEGTIGDSDSVCATRATSLLSRESIKERIKAIYEEEGTSVENQFTWTKSKSEEMLVDIVYNHELKTADRLKAISELNKMRGIDVPKVEDEETAGDAVDGFFSKLKDMVSE
ncbi:MAG: hypothetical protein ACRCX2_08010 [Paraclostridium sp.]